MFNWLKTTPKSQRVGVYHRANSQGVTHFSQGDPKIVPDNMDVTEQAPHIFTWRMTGPSITIQVLKLRDGLPAGDQVDTYVLGAA